MSGYRAVGEGRDTVVIGVLNPVRIRAQECLAQGLLMGNMARKVQNWLEAECITWRDWNSLVDLVGAEPPRGTRQS